VKLVGALVLALLAVGLSACGSSHRSSYSVRQVKSAFAEHGITLRPTRRRTTGGVVTLVGHDGVEVLVYRNPSKSAFGWTGEPPINRGNLIVFRPAGDAHAVRAALRDLH
jgi:hypothetical protein